MPPKKKMTEQEWSHFFDVEDMKEVREQLEIEASTEQMDDVARRLNIPGIKHLRAGLTVYHMDGSPAYHVSGKFNALVVQECVVTLEPVETSLSEPVEGYFADKEKAVSFAAAKRAREGSKNQGEVEILEESDDPEPLHNGMIDLGELVVQHLSLALPPYPHKEGVTYEMGDERFALDEKSPLKKNPFEALKDWKENR